MESYHMSESPSAAMLTRVLLTQRKRRYKHVPEYSYSTLQDVSPKSLWFVDTQTDRQTVVLKTIPQLVIILKQYSITQPEIVPKLVATFCSPTASFIRLVVT